MGKALFVFVLLFGLLAAALLVPVGGRTFWDRAYERGIPQAAGRGIAHGLRSGWDWVMARGEPESHRPSQLPPARPVRKAPPKVVAKAPAPPVRVAPKPGRDGIVAQPPAEALQDDDRRALDRLVSTRR